MRLFEMSQLPDKAGLATLNFGNSSRLLREGATITIPRDIERIEFFALKGPHLFAQTAFLDDPQRAD